MLDPQIYVIHKRSSKAGKPPVKGGFKKVTKQIGWYCSGIMPDGTRFNFVQVAPTAEQACKLVGDRFGVKPVVSFVSGRVLGRKNNLRWSIARFPHTITPSMTGEYGG